MKPKTKRKGHKGKEYKVLMLNDTNPPSSSLPPQRISSKNVHSQDKGLTIKDEPSAKFFRSTFNNSSTKQWRVPRQTPFYKCLIYGDDHPSLPTSSLSSNALANIDEKVEFGLETYFPGLLQLLKGEGKPSPSMWPTSTMYVNLPLSMKLGVFLQHILANVLSPTLDDFCIEGNYQQGGCSTSTSTMEMPLHGKKKKFVLPACMMLSQEKVSNTKYMTFSGYKGVEDDEDSSTYVRLQIGWVMKKKVWADAHRLTCLSFQGFPSSSVEDYACHNGCKPGGHKGCVQPYHLAWQSQAHNLSKYRNVMT